MTRGITVNIAKLPCTDQSFRNSSGIDHADCSAEHGPGRALCRGDRTPGNPRLTGGATATHYCILVVTEIVVVRVVSTWTNPGLKCVPGVAEVLAVVCGLAYRLELKMKAFD